MELLLVIVRWVHLWASIVLAALFIFELVIVEPFVRNPPEIVLALLLAGRRLSCRLAWWLWAIAQISWMAWLWLITASMSGEDMIACINSEAFGTVLFATQFGHLTNTSIGRR